MIIKNLKTTLNRLETAIQNSEDYKDYNIVLNNREFKKRKFENNQKLTKIQLDHLENLIWDLIKLGENKSIRPQIILIIKKIKKLKESYNQNEISNMFNIIQEIKKELPQEIIQPSFKIKSSLPTEIKEDIFADVNELNKCFNHGCYRSAVIICGRILETCLHRKYYEASGKDLLEKSPGIGLGKLIAKLMETKIKLDPGLTQQIHLINQLRIFSVHKKQAVFYPSLSQTKAIILYTLDTINKLF